jgi:hypothetical protein
MVYLKKEAFMEILLPHEDLHTLESVITHIDNISMLHVGQTIILTREIKSGAHRQFTHISSVYILVEAVDSHLILEEISHPFSRRKLYLSEGKITDEFSTLSQVRYTNRRVQ